MRRFEGKVALVTGGRSGIGRAIVRRLETEGAQVVTAQRRDDPECDCVAVDLADPQSPARAVRQVVDRTGRLDVLVNGAGLMQEARIEDMPFADWQAALAVNLTAPFLMIRAALPYLRATRGSIVNVGSIEALGSNPHHAAYSASKAGLHGLTRAVAVDHGAEGIRCNAVAPGWIETELNTAMIDTANDPPAFRANLGRIHPLGRTGRPEEVAALVAFLAAEESGFITGQVYAIDGGRMSKLSLP
ncbi:SDR family NAD(P)-dependent oxidoreductase [Pontibaca methylaminivorans]|uniref:SDR family NAD(P)-dependent oxidoreductase n=1 Tax=Pontibaca methylaminivorans TaxID=515897 RepID=UPI002FD95048